MKIKYCVVRSWNKYGLSDECEPEATSLGPPSLLQYIYFFPIEFILSYAFYNWGRRVLLIYHVSLQPAFFGLQTVNNSCSNWLVLFFFSKLFHIKPLVWCMLCVCHVPLSAIFEWVLMNSIFNRRIRYHRIPNAVRYNIMNGMNMERIINNPTSCLINCAFCLFVFFVFFVVISRAIHASGYATLCIFIHNAVFFSYRWCRVPSVSIYNSDIWIFPFNVETSHLNAFDPRDGGHVRQKGLHLI